jgi:curved DNA-binding protein CbpA
LAKQHHPDAGGTQVEKFKAISEAYEVLSNKETKRNYDEARVEKEQR